MKPTPRKTMLAAAALAAAQGASAGNVVFNVIDLGTLGGLGSQARALNDSGVVVGDIANASDPLLQAFQWKNGALTVLSPSGTTGSARAVNNLGEVVGGLGSSAVRFSRPLGFVGPADTFSSVAHGTNDGSWVVGTATLSSGFTHGWLGLPNGQTLNLSRGSLQDVGTGAYAVSNNGHIAGTVESGNSTRAALWQGAQLIWSDGTPPTPGLNSALLGVNNLGDAVGYATNATGSHAYVYRNQSWQPLGSDLAPPGPIPSFRLTTSWANGINDLGQAVGGASMRFVGDPPIGPPRDRYGFLHAEGQRIRLDTLLASGSSTTVSDAVAINQHGQIAANGANGHALLLTPSGVVTWRGGGSGSFTDTAAWDSGGLGFSPNRFLSASIDGAGSTTVTLHGAVRTPSVLLGSTLNGVGTQTLQLDAGVVDGTVVIGERGLLTGSGTVGATGNFGRVLVLGGDRVTVHGGLDNRASTRVLAGGVLELASGQLVNRGTLEVFGGATLQNGERLLNQGQVQLSGSGAVLNGSLDNAAGATVVLARLGGATVAGTLKNDGSITASSGATLRYEGLVTGNGDFFAGTGARHVFTRRWAPGGPEAASINAAMAQIDGALMLDIGATSDHVSFTSGVWFNAGSRVLVNLLDGFVPQLGNGFSLFSFANAPGATGALLTLPGLADGLAWDSSTLFTDGWLRVAAVPEPASGALLLAGLAGAWLARRRRTGVLAAGAFSLLALAGPAHAAFTEPNVHFSFLAQPAPDLDGDPFVTTASGQLLANGGVRQYTGTATANLYDGTLRVRYQEHYSGPGSGGAVFSSVGHATTARLWDTLAASSSGWITLALTGDALVSSSNIGTRDDSWAGWGFAMTGEVFNPGGGGLVGGGGQATASADYATYLGSPTGTARNAGLAPARKAVVAGYAITGANHVVLTLTAYVNAGDRLNFSITAAGRGWADDVLGAEADANLLNTARLSVTGSPGMRWASESGVLLTAVPEPAAWALLLPGLLLVLRRRRSG